MEQTRARTRTRTLVTASKWCVSTTFPNSYLEVRDPNSNRLTRLVSDGLYRLSVHFHGENHPDHDGKLFRNRHDADEYCLKHGLLKPFVPSKPSVDRSKIPYEARVGDDHSKHF